MPVYLVATLEIHDAEGFKPYVGGVPPIVEKYGGRFLVRGGELEVIQGEWPVPRLTIVEFPTIEQARRFWDAPEYAEYRALRGRTARTNAVFVKGVPG